MDLVQSGRTAFLRTFCWTNGHADLAPVFGDAETLAALGPALATPFRDSGVTKVVALEARGFVLGALCAQHLGVGVVLARKAGSVHPGDKVEVVSDTDWRGQHVKIRLVRILRASDRVLLVDDWIETGSQARAARKAIETCGAHFVGASVIVDDTNDQVRAELQLAALVRSFELSR